MLIGCFSQGCVNDEDPQGIALKAGDSLPDFSVVLSDGSEISKSSLLGYVPVIVFFNTGCSDCRLELPVIQRLWEEYKNNSEVKIFAVAREENAESISDYWSKNNLTIPWSPQETRDVYSLFAPSVIPRIYIADKSGIITFASGDVDMPDLKTLSKAIEDNL